MQNKIPSHLSDSELVAAVADLVIRERQVTVTLIAHLAELEARELYLPAGCPSMFVYCVQVLRLSEGGAYNRIEVARAARRFPPILGLLAEGALNLATVRILAPHLTPENHERLLAGASRKSKREVERLVARTSPEPDVAASVRKLPNRKASDVGSSVLDVPVISADAATRFGNVECGDGESGPSSVDPFAASHDIASAAASPTPHTHAFPPPRHPLVTPLSEDRYQIRFTASGSTAEKLRRAQDLLRHAVPNGDPAEIFDRALTALLKDLERKKFAATGHPRSSRGVRAGSRAIPPGVKRSVVSRDQGRCAFLGSDGRQCGERGFLEFHHVVPYARGGPATADNIQLRCRAHNAYEADVFFGKSKWTGGRRDSNERRAAGEASPVDDRAARQLVPGRVGLVDGRSITRTAGEDRGC